MTHVCGCANCRILGQTLPAGVYPNIPSTERPRLAPCTSLITLLPVGIEIADMSKVQFRAHSHSCSDLFCVGCRKTFRFFVGHGAIYAAPITEQPRCRLQTYASSSNVNSKSVPPYLQPYVKGGQPPQPRLSLLESSQISPSDPDFDLMFSSRADPVIGSCRRDEDVVEGRTGGSADFAEFGPRSFSRQPRVPKL
jgi:hypothetical protein